MEKLKSGDRAPLFKVWDTEGNPQSTTPGNSWCFLSFHRFTTCPFCNLRTHELKNNYHLFQEQDIEIISLWPASRKALFRDVKEKMKVPFAMVADEEMELYNKYGVNGSSKGSLKYLLKEPLLLAKSLKYLPASRTIDGQPELLPANFLINPDGIIKIAHYGKHIGDHLPIKDILNFKSLYHYEKSNA